MAPRSETGSGNGLTPEQRERLERIVIELLDIAAHCEESPAIQYELRELTNRLVQLVEQ